MNKNMYVLAAAMICASLNLLGAETTTAKSTIKPAANAKTEQAVKIEKNDSWLPFQLVFFPGFPAGSMNSNVRGLKLGIPATGGHGYVYGIEASFFYSGTSIGPKNSAVKGIQASWFGPVFAGDVYGVQATQTFGYARCVKGLQAGPVIFAKEYSYGVQAAGGGVAMNGFDGFQAGAANVTCGDFNGFQLGVANVVTKNCKGFQCGAFASAEEMTGCQCTLVNVISKVSKAFQCGVVNYSNGKGFQLGAVNIIKDGVIPVMIICNFSF